MRARLFALMALIASAAVVGYMAGPVSRAADTPGFSKESDVRAAVVSVQRLDFPRARLTLKVTHSAHPEVFGITGAERTVTVDNYLWTKSGKVDYSNRLNIGSVAAYYLLQGDEIRGKLVSGSSAPGQDAEWLICGVERVAAGDAATGPVRSARMQGDLQFTLEAAQQVYKTGEPVRMSLTVENTGSQPETLRFSSGQQYDFTVTQAGSEIWRWSADRFFIQALTQFTLAPGAKRTFAESWAQKDNDGRQVKPGEYQVQSVLTLSGPRAPVGPVTVTVRAKQ